MPGPLDEWMQWAEHPLVKGLQRIGQSGVQTGPKLEENSPFANFLSMIQQQTSQPAPFPEFQEWWRSNVYNPMQQAKPFNPFQGMRSPQSGQSPYANPGRRF